MNLLSIFFISNTAKTKKQTTKTEINKTESFDIFDAFTAAYKHI
ncbi:hypothetical protein [Metabacillus fastidiosus]